MAGMSSKNLARCGRHGRLSRLDTSHFAHGAGFFAATAADAALPSCPLSWNCYLWLVDVISELFPMETFTLARLVVVEPSTYFASLVAISTAAL